MRLPRLYGITHDTRTGEAIVRVPRFVTVRIGQAAGPDLFVYIDPNQGKWVVKIKNPQTNAYVLYPYPSKEQCRAAYADLKPKAPLRKAPTKTSYFTFVRATGDGTYEPDFDAIEAHGSLPRELDIMFVDDTGWNAAYQMWTSKELKCFGDGLTALRVLSLARTPDQLKLAKDAADAGDRYFPILEGHCYEGDCEYAKPMKGPSGREVAPPCKPHGQLKFQLLKMPRLGAIAQFDTTGKRSCGQISSCLHRLLSFTGQGQAERGSIAGVPLKLVLAPYKTSAPSSDKPGERVPSMAYGVSIEFRPEDASRQVQSLIEKAQEYKRVLRMEPSAVGQIPAVAPEPAQIEAPVLPQEQVARDETEPIEDDSEGEEDIPPQDFGDPAQMTAEFYSEPADKIIEAQEPPGSIDLARRAAVNKIVREFGWTYEQIDAVYDPRDGDMFLRLREKHGLPPGNYPERDTYFQFVDAQEAYRRRQVAQEASAELKRVLEETDEQPSPPKPFRFGGKK